MDAWIIQVLAAHFVAASCLAVHWKFNGEFHGQVVREVGVASILYLDTIWPGVPYVFMNKYTLSRRAMIFKPSLRRLSQVKKGGRCSQKSLKSIDVT